MHKKVCIILINWNNFEDTKECINSLLNSTETNFDIVVVDNNSIIKPNFTDKRIKVIYLSENLGFAGANNIGIKYAAENKYEYVWILNNDTIVERDTLLVLLDAATSSESQVITNLILYYDTPNQIWFAGGYYSKIFGKGIHRYINRNVNKVQLKRTKTEFATGCSIFINTKVFEDIGLFDEKLFAYSEDLDLSMRLKKRGYNILFVPQAVVYHKVGRSFKINNTASEGKSSPLQVYLFARNRIIVSRRYMSKINFSLFYLNFFLLNALKAAILFLINRREKSKMLFAALLNGLRM